MQRIPTLSLLLLLSTLAAANARAVDLHAASEGRAPSVSLGAFVGGHFFAEGANLGVARGSQASQGARSNAAAGLRASFGLGRWFTAEAEVLGLATEDRTFQRKARILGYRFNAMANLMAGDFRPFVLVGAGAIQVASTDADGNAGLVRDTDGEVHAGVGFDYRLVHKLSLRGDARVVQMPSKQTWGLITDVEATLGAVVTFGGGASSSAHAPSPEADAAHSTVVPAELPVMAPLVAESPRTQVVRQDAQHAQHEIEASRSGEVAEESEAVALATNARTVSDLLERAKEIRFEGTTSKISDASMPFLVELAAALVKEPGVRLEILCHTGDSGDAKKDLALTKRRAEAVKYLLVGKGASTDQLVATGRGSEDPIAPNLTRSGRARNERVELHRAGAR
jgi:outer membrane protein OmpA-like peptidoglycan-associated protein